MPHCNYIPLQVSHSDAPAYYLDDLLDLDVLCTEEGILINIPSE